MPGRGLEPPRPQRHQHLSLFGDIGNGFELLLAGHVTGIGFAEKWTELDSPSAVVYHQWVADPFNRLWHADEVSLQVVDTDFLQLVND